MVARAGNAARNFPNVAILDSFGYFQVLFRGFQLREKSPNTDFFLVCIFLYLDCIQSPYSVRIQENTDQERLHIWTLFTQFAILVQRLFPPNYFSLFTFVLYLLFTIVR